jgi:hypothetical protein
LQADLHDRMTSVNRIVEECVKSSKCVFRSRRATAAGTNTCPPSDFVERHITA